MVFTPVYMLILHRMRFIYLLTTGVVLKEQKSHKEKISFRQQKTFSTSLSFCAYWVVWDGCVRVRSYLLPY